MLEYKISLSVELFRYKPIQTDVPCEMLEYKISLRGDCERVLSASLFNYT